MNWGKGIVAGMVLFIVFILSMCIYMFRMPVDEYDHQYYEKGLNFNKDFDKEKQVSVDHAQPIINVEGPVAKISFVAPATGTIRFLRPSSEALDKLLRLDGNKEQTISLTNIVRGRWQVVLEWESNKKAYLYQQDIYIK